MAELAQISPHRALDVHQEHEAVTPMAAYGTASRLTGMAARWPSTTKNKGHQCHMVTPLPMPAPVCPFPSQQDLGSPWDAPQKP